MRWICVVALPIFALLLPHSAIAEPRKSRQPPPPVAAPVFPLWNFWRPQMLQPRAHVGAIEPRAHVGAVERHSASTGCLPPQLQAALAGVQARFGPVTVISTHRAGARIRGGRPSLHASCRAVDFKPAPGTYRQVAAYLRSSWNGGVGTYRSGHIHIDLGDNYRWGG